MIPIAHLSQAASGDDGQGVSARREGEKPVVDLSQAVWRKSRRSGLDGCVEVAVIDGSRVAVRDSKDRSGPVLTFSPTEWEAFVGGVRDGEFDLT
jgi:hypothetical protein